MSDERLRVSVEAANNLAGGLNSSAASIQGWASRVSGQLAGVTSAFGSLRTIAGVGIATKLFKELFDAGVEAQETMQNLAGAVVGAGKNFRQFAGDLEATIEKLHGASRFDDEEIRRGLTSIIQMSGEVEASQKSLSAVTDFAA